MGTISTTLTIDDQMSNNLDVIITKSQKLDKTLQPIAHLKIETDAFDEMGNSIEEVTAIIENKVIAVKDAKESIEGLNVAIDTGGRGMSFMIMGSTRLLGSFGLMPRAAGSAIMGLTQLNRGLDSTITRLSVVTAKIAPLIFLSTAVFGIVSAVRALGSEAVEVEEVSRSFSALNSEADRLESSLRESVVLLGRLKRSGADTSLVDSLAAENEGLEAIIVGLRRTAQREADAAADAAIASMNRVYIHQGDAVRIMVGHFNIYENAMKYVESLTRGVFEMTAKEMVSGFVAMMEAGMELDDAQRDMVNTFHDSATAIDGYLMNLREAGRVSSECYTITLDLVRRIQELDEATGNSSDSLEKAKRALVDWADSARDAGRAVRDLQRGFGRFGSIADGVTDAWYAMNSAMHGTTFGYGNAIDAFEALYNIGYQNIHMLFDYEGNLLAVEDAITAVYAAQIELMALEMANNLIAQAQAAYEAGIAMDGYAYAVDGATLSLREMALQAAETYGVLGQVLSIFGMADEATRVAVGGGRGGGSRLPLTSRGAVRAGIDEPIEIKGENLRMLIDAAERRRAEALRPVSLNASFSIENPVIHSMADYEEIKSKFTHELVSELYDAYHANARH